VWNKEKLMRKIEWYRNEVWDKNIEKNFNVHLKRVRLKQDYLRIQASYLTDNAPVAALALLDRYFELGMHFDMAHAWYDRAVAYSSVGKTYFALDAYTKALQEEELNSTRLTQSYLGLPMLVADDAAEAWYPMAIDVLERHAGRLVSHRDYFEWNASYALIMSDKGYVEDAIKYALEAIQAKEDHTNGRKHHINVGSMRNDDRHNSIYSKITIIAIGDKPSLKRRFGRIFSN
jgi:tetratricopeptide (TPR) repeat protein